MARHLYRLWLILLILSGSIALWFLIGTANSLWNYVRLNAKTIAEETQWQVKELTSSRFSLESNYQYVVKGVVYQGHTIFKTPQFLNRYSAESHIDGLDLKRYRVWYRESYPKYSSMEREFPQKNCLQALLTLGVFSYFYFARGKVLKFF